jgi:hypothetical protein
MMLKNIHAGTIDTPRNTGRPMRKSSAIWGGIVTLTRLQKGMKYLFDADKAHFKMSLTL